MGKSLEAGAEDGEISQEDIVGEVVAGTVTAATLLAGRGLNNFLASKAAESGASSRILDDAGKAIYEGDRLLPNNEFAIDGVKCATDDLGQLYRVGDDLVPNMSYEINGYKYVTDAMGRVESAEGFLQLKTHEGRLTIKDTIQSIGKGFEELFDQRGHLIADRFNGSNGLENIVAMGGEVNQKAYAAIEQKCADALADGAEVFFKVEPLYEGGSFRPSSFAITDIIDGEETVTFLLNTAKEML